MADSVGNRLRRRRQETGLTQAELAERAGVSRQLVAAVESGHNTPAVDAAIGLARALMCSAEELFSERERDFTAASGEPLRPGASVRVGRVGDRMVASEMSDHGVAGAGWARPDGVIEAEGLRLFSNATPAGLVIAGCDPALGLAEAMLQGMGARSLLAISAPTGKALRALDAGAVHAAVVHGPAESLPRPPVPATRWHLARWQVGLAVAPAVAEQSLEAVLGAGIPVVLREAAAGSQQAFERAATAAGVAAQPGPTATGHLDAARTAGILQTAAVTTEGAAHAFGLRFLALEEHTVEIWFAEGWRDHPGVLGLGELLTSGAFMQRITRFAGYDLTGCGAPVGAAAA